MKKKKCLLTFLADRQTIIIVKSGEKDAEKDFLGYEFSNRRGKEGIHLRGNGKLLDEKDFYNAQKVNSYILKKFLNKEIDSVNESLKDHVFIQSFVDCFDWERGNFDGQISLNTQKKNFNK